MQVCGVLISVLLWVGALFGESLQGIQMSDIDQKADPCTDFYEYANGTGAPQPDSGVDGPLEPTLASGRGEQREDKDHLARSCCEN